MGCSGVFLSEFDHECLLVEFLPRGLHSWLPGFLRHPLFLRYYPLSPFQSAFVLMIEVNPVSKPNRPDGILHHPLHDKSVLSGSHHPPEASPKRSQVALNARMVCRGASSGQSQRYGVWLVVRPLGRHRPVDWPTSRVASNIECVEPRHSEF